MGSLPSCSEEPAFDAVGLKLTFIQILGYSVLSSSGLANLLSFTIYLLSESPLSALTPVD